MAKKVNQDSVKQDFFRRLARGQSVDEAKSLAGINCDETLSEYIKEYYERQATDSLHVEAIQLAIATLKEIASRGEEEDRVRCDAAKALLKFASDNIRNKVDASIGETKAEIVKNLWDF